MRHEPMTEAERKKADEARGYREYYPCGDCGGMRYQFFIHPTQSWSEQVFHLDGENCIQNLQARISALEKLIAQKSPPVTSRGRERAVEQLQGNNGTTSG